MDNFEKPMLDLLQDKDNPGVNMLSVCGGNGTFCVEIADAEAAWQHAINPDGSEDVVQVWRSDQGFEAPRNWTWPIEDTIALVGYYYKRGQPHPEYKWF